MPKTSRSISSPAGGLALAIGFYLVVTVTLRLVEPDRPTVGPPGSCPGSRSHCCSRSSRLTRHVSRRARWLRKVGIALIMGLVVLTVISTVILIDDLITGGRVTESASPSS